MNRVKEFIKNVFKRYLDSFKRLPVTQGIVVLCGVIFCVAVIFELEDKVTFCLFFGFIISLGISLLCSYYFKNIVYNALISVLLFVSSYLVFYYNFDNIYVYLAYGGLCLIIFILFINRLLSLTNRNLFMYLLSRSFYVNFLSTILLFGLIICTLGFSSLIFSFNDDYKIYFIIFILVEVFSATLFISYFPFNNENLSYNNVFDTLLSKIPLSLYYLLLFILYLYLIKIIITWKMPVGVINIFASIVLTLYVYFSYVSIDDFFLSKFHQKYGSYLLIPIFIIQQISIFIRVDAYGLTTLRLCSLIYNFVCLIFIILSIINKRNLFFIITCFIIFIFTVIPYINIYDLPSFEQEVRLKNILSSNNMFKDGKIIPSSSIDSNTKQKVISCYDYLNNYSSSRFTFVKDVDFKDTFGFDYGYYDSNFQVEHCFYHNFYDSLDVHDYNGIEFIEYTFVENNQYKGLVELCEDTYKKYGNSFGDAELILELNDYEILYLSGLYFDIDYEGNISNIEISGYRLYK